MKERKPLKKKRKKRKKKEENLPNPQLETEEIESL